MANNWKLQDLHLKDSTVETTDLTASTRFKAVHILFYMILEWLD